MKLRHLLLASFAACAFASCSDDSSNGIEIPEENYQMIDANVSLTATALDGIQTKGATKEGGDAVLESGSNNEQFINELTAYLFYVDNGENEDAYKFAAMKTVSSTDGNSVKTIEDIVVKVKATAAGELSDTQLAVVFLANTKLATPPSNLGDVKTAELEDLVDFTHVHPAPGVTQTYVPMFSQIVTIGGGEHQLLAGTKYDNWVKGSTAPSIIYTNNATAGSAHKEIEKKSEGEWTEKGSSYDPANISDADKIPLTRHVARVQLQAIDCDFKNNYADASFELTHVYIANASNTSLIYADAEPYSLDNATAYSHGCTYTRDDYFLVDGSQNVPSLHWTMDAGVDIAMTGNDHSKNISNGNINYDGTYWFKFDDQTIEGDEGDPSNRHKEMPQFYVFEMKGNKPMLSDDLDKSDSPSGNIQTMLILRGNWYPNGKKTGLSDDKKDVVKRDRYYRIPIKQDATSGIIGVQRNTIYKIYATITGEGSKDPDTSELNACISFSIKVEPWTLITQTETDVN